MGRGFGLSFTVTGSTGFKDDALARFHVDVHPDMKMTSRKSSISYIVGLKFLLYDIEKHEKKKMEDR